MEPILVDTSVWIDWFHGRITPETELVAGYLVQSAPLYITPTILQEALQGVKNDQQYPIVKASLLALNLLSIDYPQAAIGAAELYRHLRKNGVTIRKANDCLIAFFALFHDISILHNDFDFTQIATHSRLRTVKL